MKRTILIAMALLLTCSALVFAIERFDAIQHERKLIARLGQQVQMHGDRLQQRIDNVVTISRELARLVSDDPEMTEESLADATQQVLAGRPAVRGVSISRQSKVVFVRPVHGNESIIGLDYALHPVFNDSISRAIASGGTVTDAPRRLLQTDKMGFIARTPIVDSSQALLGIVSVTVDIEDLLLDAGLLAQTLTFTPVIVQYLADQPKEAVFGNLNLLPAAESSFDLELPDGRWELHAVPNRLSHDTSQRSRWIRMTGAAVTLLLLTLLLRHQGVLGKPTSILRPSGVSLRAVMALLVLIPTTSLVVGTGWLSYQAARQLTGSIEQQQVAQLGKQIRAQVTAFSEVPRHANAFIAELFRQGILDAQSPKQLLNSFLAQLRHEPLLTILSLGTAQGDYYSATRPPLGNDKTLRIIRATAANQHVMAMQRVDVNNRPTGQITVANDYFDPRAQVWFKAAQTANRLIWYPPYRYAAGKGAQEYETLGLGMAAPVYDPQGEFIGIISADVAMSQLSDFLTAKLDQTDSLVFITESDGNLLANSVGQEVYRMQGSDVVRITAEESSNPGIRAAGAHIRQAGTETGNHFVKVEGKRYLLDWQLLKLPDGPALTIALMTPKSHFAEVADQGLWDMVYLTLAFLSLGLLITFLFTYWFAQPLLLLEQWARRLGAGEWQASPPSASPIREVASLTTSLDAMATQLRQHAEELENRVMERTEALAQANQKLAKQSMTDGLTGIANRRRFDDVFNTEFTRFMRNGQPLALLLIDVDFFKSYNDEHGHLAGDDALKRIAQVLREHARRPSDLAARYGGEEFAVIAADTSEHNALQIAERIRLAIAELALPHTQGSHSVITISIGVAVATRGACLEPTGLLSLADQALYRAKRSGRNKVVIADGTLDSDSVSRSVKT